MKKNQEGDEPLGYIFRLMLVKSGSQEVAKA